MEGIENKRINGNFKIYNLNIWVLAQNAMFVFAGVKIFIEWSY